MIDELKKTKRKLLRFYANCKTLKLIKNEMGDAGIEVNLLLFAHALEKGMGLPHPRRKFGLDKANNLLKMLEDYESMGADIHCYAFVESLSVLSTYFKFTDNDCDEQRRRCQVLCQKHSELLTAGFNEILDMASIYDNLDMKKITYFIKSRHSIRSFIDQPLDERILTKVLELAQHAPSACNRQSVKVYFTNSTQKVKEIDGLIPGNKGFEGEIPNWVIITADRFMFGYSEPLQWYVNGGIYLAYFVEALHAYKIGSCIFQIPPIHQNTPKLRNVASIPDSEAIIAAVGLGYAKSPNKFLAAMRKPVNEVLVRF